MKPPNVTKNQCQKIDDKKSQFKASSQITCNIPSKQNILYLPNSFFYQFNIFPLPSNEKVSSITISIMSIIAWTRTSHKIIRFIQFKFKRMVWCVAWVKIISCSKSTPAWHVARIFQNLVILVFWPHSYCSISCISPYFDSSPFSSPALWDWSVDPNKHLKSPVFVCKIKSNRYTSSFKDC